MYQTPLIEHQHCIRQRSQGISTVSDTVDKGINTVPDTYIINTVSDTAAAVSAVSQKQIEQNFEYNMSLGYIRGR
jgi:hypothetical protein